MTTKARTLKTLVDNFDQINTFKIEIVSPRRTVTRTAYLVDFESEGQIYIMLHAVCLKSKYTEADVAEIDRLASEEPIRNGDTVIYQGEKYRVKIIGEYSDAGRLVKI